jgi:predicted Zn-ribbon and HTH transcriptional regulator
MPELRCLRCGYEWDPLAGPPKVCPKCKSYYWNEPHKRPS